MKNINPLGLFDEHFLLVKLTKLGDPLKKLNDYIGWDIFRDPLDKAFAEETDRSKEGRPAFDRLMMFKALIV
jgi:IS5 family transposase